MIVHEKYKNVIFYNTRSNFKNIIEKHGTKVKEVINIYLNKYGEINKKYKFIFDTKEINKNDQRTSEDFFMYYYSKPTITFIEY